MARQAIADGDTSATLRADCSGMDRAERDKADAQRAVESHRNRRIDRIVGGIRAGGALRLETPGGSVGLALAATDRRAALPHRERRLPAAVAVVDYRGGVGQRVV